MDKIKKTITYILNYTNTDQKNLKQGYLHFYTNFMYQGQHQPNGYFYQYVKRRYKIFQNTTGINLFN